MKIHLLAVLVFPVVAGLLPMLGVIFFSIIPRPDGRLSVAMADVTGHGMEAAIPTVLFSGMLDNQMENAFPPEDSIFTPVEAA